METTTEKAQRFNDGKVQWSMLDLLSLQPLADVCGGWDKVNFNSLEEVVRVMAFGAKKYARDNWKKGLLVSKITDSMLRHLICTVNGQVNDEETGLNHYAHIVCNGMFINYMLLHHSDLDDRQSVLDLELTFDDSAVVQTVADVNNKLFELISAFAVGQNHVNANQFTMGLILRLAVTGITLTKNK